jgi:predicted acetylornithine/succinylornithine family transaminase
MLSSEIIRLTDEHIFPTYQRYPVAIVKGKGSRVWDAEGREYLDFCSGISVCNLGHRPPQVVQAVRRQLNDLMHISNLYYSEPQAELARLLTENSFADRVFFCNSGAEANEAAIKLARKFFKDRGEENRSSIVTMLNSFHGRTFGAMSATGQEKFHRGFEPILPGFKYVPFDHLGAAEEAIDETTCAVMVEPVQTEGGINCPSEGYLKGLRDLCNERGTLLIFDEVQVGIGRTGTLFAYEHDGAQPDMMTLAKALGGGLPMGAMLATEELARSLTYGTHASTFGGNPVSAAAGVATVKSLLTGRFLRNCRKMGAHLSSGLEALKAKHHVVRQIRGKGLVLGMELTVKAKPVVDECLRRGFLIHYTMDTVLRFHPPLTIRKKEIDSLLSTLDDVLSRQAEAAS